MLPILLYIVIYCRHLVCGFSKATCWAVGVQELVCNKHRDKLEDDDDYCGGFDELIPDYQGSNCDQCLSRAGFPPQHPKISIF